MMIDSHAHYARKAFDQSFRFLSFENGDYRIHEGDRELILARMKESGIAASIEPGVELESNPEVLRLSGEYPGFIFPAVGVHPTRTAVLRWKDRKTMVSLSGDPRVIAIGETGLDYHLDRKDQHRIRQFFWFWFQIRLAHRLKLPLILHIRRAHRDAILILKANRRKLHGGVAHCFCGTLDEGLELTALGFSLGIGGALLQQDSQSEELQEAVRKIPLEKILVETDAPYVPPYYRDESISKKAKQKVRNTSLILPAVIRRISELKGMDESEVEAAVFRNTTELLGLHPGEK